MFYHSKKTATMNLEHIDRFVPKNVQNLFFEQFDGGVSDRAVGRYVDGGTTSNILKPSILTMFVNLRQLTIYATDKTGGVSYVFSLSALVKMLLRLQVEVDFKCALSGTWKGTKHRSWL